MLKAGAAQARAGADATAAMAFAAGMHAHTLALSYRCAHVPVLAHALAGRASYVESEVSAGVVDAGAEAVATWLAGAAAAVE